MKQYSADPLIQNIISSIEFRLFNVHDVSSFSETADINNYRCYQALDVANTVIRDNSCNVFSLPLLQTPRFSTVAIGYLLNRLVSAMPQNQTYLNIGTWCGFSFSLGY